MREDDPALRIDNKAGGVAGDGGYQQVF